MAQIDTDAVFKQIKKQNGEAVAHVVRSALLLDVPNIVHILEFAGRNPDDIKQLAPVIREIYKTKTKSTYTSTKEPLDLLDDAGYDAFVVTNLKQQNSIKKYFRPDEELCTFRDPNRYVEYYMIHAVKRGADKIQPLPNPQREDEYGTSVISIQIARTGGFISIKNRYNHTISNPDATFNNNPDNIILGLSDSLKTYFGVDFNTARTRIPDNFRVVNDQMVRYDYELNNTYFCTTHYFSGSTITKLNNNDQILFANGFILYIAKGNNRVEAPAGNNMEFCNALTAFIHDKKITQSVDKDTGLRTIFVDNKPFMGIQNGEVMFLNAPNLDVVEVDNSSRIKLSGDLDYSGVRILNLYNMDLKNVTSIKMNPNAEQIILGPGIKLSGDLDFSGVKNLNLSRADLTNVTNIKFNPNAETIVVGKNNLKLSGNLDFSGVKDLYLSDADLTNVTNIKFNPNASRILIPRTKLSGDLDFKRSFGDDQNHFSVDGADLTKVTSIKFDANGEYMYLNGAILAGNWDFSKVKKLNLENADLTRVNSIKFNPNAELIIVGRKLKLSGDLDFSGVEHLDLKNADFTNVKHIKFNPNAVTITIDSDNLPLSGDLDFSGVIHLDLENADFTNVKNIKFNPNACDIHIGKNLKKLSGNLDFSGVKDLLLQDADLTNVPHIEFNPNAYRVYLLRTKLAGDLDFKQDFGNAGLFYLTGSDLTKVTSVKFDANGEYMNLDGAILAGDWDFSKVKELCLSEADLTRVNSIKFPTNGEIDVGGAKFDGNLDFSNRKQIDLRGADLTKVTNIRFTPDTRLLNLYGGKLAGDLDFSNIDIVNLELADLRNVNSIKFNPKAHISNNIINDGFDISTRVTLNGADLRNPKLNPLFNVKDGYVNLCDARLAGDLDFSAVKYLLLHRADLTHVTSIKLPQKLYNEIKGDKCKVNDCDYAYIEDLPKHGIKVKKIGPFEIAKQKVIERFGNMFSNNNDDENAGGR